MWLDRRFGPNDVIRKLRSDAMNINGYFPTVINIGVVIGMMTWVVKAINGVKDEGDKKRGRIYERVDEHKRFTDDTFVRSKECQIMHKQLVDAVLEMKIDIKELLKINGGKNSN